MKLPTMIALAGLLACTAACGEDAHDDAAAAPPAGSVAPPPTTPAPPGAKRTMTTARAMATAPDNLLYDPTFSTLGNSIAYAVYAPNGHRWVPPTSPSGPATAVLETPSGAGNASQVVLLGQGGAGPLEASVWIAERGGDPPGVYLASMTDGTAVFQLDRAPGEADQKHGDLTYQLYRVSVDAPMLGMVGIVVDVSSVKDVVIAAPELRAATGAKTKDLRPPARRVALSSRSRAALAALAGRGALPIPEPPKPAPRPFESPLYGR